MAVTRETTPQRVVFFMFLIFLVVAMSPIATLLFEGELLGLVGTLVFFLTFVLFYSITEYFVKLDGGESVSELGVDWDDSTLTQIVIGAIGGTLGAALVLAIAWGFGGDTRPVSEITTDLIAAEIIITTPTAIFEELVHRGYVLPRVESLTTRSRAIIVSSLFFSLLHFSWWSVAGFRVDVVGLFVLNMFLGGVVLSMAYYFTGRRLWVPISFHFMWNMVAYLTFPEFPRTAVYLPQVFQIEWGLTTILGFIFGLSLIWGLWMSYGKKE